ncbi:MAG: SDR family NAD(P)-dependent oxidoreductase [Hyphomonadaceae bacterium]
MDLLLKGKRALVTGGNRGIGKAVARVLAQEGCDVVIAARNVEALEATAKELKAETGAKIGTATVDTAFDDQVKAAVDKAVAFLGGLDILVNSAAVVAGGPAPKLAQMNDKNFYDDVNVKVMGYLRMAREAAPHMAKNGWGRIINISGLGARQAGSIIGSVRNVAVAALTKNLADELGPQGINVTVVHPGGTKTEASEGRAKGMGMSMEDWEKRVGAGTAVGRMITAEEVADVVAFLASPKSISITGDAVATGGGPKGVIYY